MSVAQISIALIICSTRSPRVGPAVASWVLSTISTVPSPEVNITTIDLHNWALPISPVGAVIPAKQPKPVPDDAYGHPVVNAWSKEISKHQAFIFLTPQYNWSFPAAVKCAVDHLFHEWAGKPGLIVSYAKSGGGQCSAALRQVLFGAKLASWEGKVELPLIAGNGVQNSERGILDEEVVKAWEEGKEKEDLLAMWKELVTLAGERAKI